MLLFSLLTSRKAILLIFPKVYWKNKQLSTHSAQISIWTRPKIYIFPSDHPFIISPLFFTLSSLQSRLLVKWLLSLRRRRRAWRWRGNGHLEMYSTTALPTNPRLEAANWQPRCLVATPPPCWNAWLPSPPMMSLFCQSTVQEKAKPGKEREQHVRWSLSHKCSSCWEKVKLHITLFIWEDLVLNIWSLSQRSPLLSL